MRRLRLSHDILVTLAVMLRSPLMDNGDRDWMFWNSKDLEAAKPKPTKTKTSGQRAWELRKDGDSLVAGFIGRGEYGFEVQIYKNKQLLFGQLFTLRAQAERCAGERREEFERAGWKTPPDHTP